ncbi:LOW QUALITY PROTEIN: hypothetical protein MAR_024187, partial [Mya arenaria]
MLIGINVSLYQVPPPNVTLLTNIRRRQVSSGYIFSLLSIISSNRTHLCLSDVIIGQHHLNSNMRMKVKVDGMSEKRSSNSSVDHCDPSHNGEDTSDPSPHGDELSDPGCEVHDTCDPCCHGDVSECNLHREETSDPSLNSDGLRDPYHTCDEP